MWVKIRLRVVTKLTFGISTRGTSYLIPTQKPKYFGDRKGALPALLLFRIDVVFQKPIGLITPIQVYPPKSPLYRRENCIAISFSIRELFKNQQACKKTVLDKVR